MSGDMVTVRVTHPAGVYAYPLRVDPYVTDELLAGANTNWREAFNGTKFTVSGLLGSGSVTIAGSEHLQLLVQTVGMELERPDLLQRAKNRLAGGRAQVATAHAAGDRSGCHRAFAPRCNPSRSGAPKANPRRN